MGHLVSPVIMNFKKNTLSRYLVLTLNFCTSAVVVYFRNSEILCAYEMGLWAGISLYLVLTYMKYIHELNV